MSVRPVQEPSVPAEQHASAAIQDLARLVAARIRKADAGVLSRAALLGSDTTAYLLARQARR